MKLLSIANSKSIWLFATNDLNPTGATYDALMEKIQERYEFQVLPNTAQLLEFTTKKQAIQFQMGSFQSSKGKVGIAVTYYSDGLMIETRAGTDIADECMADILQWLNATYSATDVRELKIHKIYSSEVYVSLEQSLNLLNPKLENFGAAVGRKAQWPHPTPKFEVTGVVFGADPTSKTQQPPFRLERDMSAAFEDQRYFSAAPLKTADHLEFLNQLEAALVWSLPRAEQR